MKKRLWLLTYSVLGMGLFAAVLRHYCSTPGIPPAVLKKKWAVKPSAFISVHGMEVHYRVEGTASEYPPLVLLHGTSSSLFTWNGWVKLLGGRQRIIRLDLPGFGLTGPHPRHDYRLETYLAFLESFLARLGIEQCILAGNSLGGEIAWRYALHHPQQVKKLILVGAAGYPVDVKTLPLRELPLHYLLLRIPLIRDMSLHCLSIRSIRTSLEYLYGDRQKVSNELLALYWEMMLREGNRQALANRMKSFNRQAPWQKIVSINIPTLILWGGRDRLMPLQNAGMFHRDLLHSRLVIFPEAGHMPMEEIPLESGRAAEAFLEEHSSSTTSAGDPAV